MYSSPVWTEEEMEVTSLKLTRLLVVFTMYRVMDFLSLIKVDEVVISKKNYLKEELSGCQGNLFLVIEYFITGTPCQRTV